MEWPLNARLVWIDVGRAGLLQVQELATGIILRQDGAIAALKALRHPKSDRPLAASLFRGGKRNVRVGGRQQVAQIVLVVFVFAVGAALVEPVLEMFAGSGRELREE